jgi:hypothetical protein
VEDGEVQFVTGLLLHVNIYPFQKAPLSDIIILQKHENIPPQKKQNFFVGWYLKAPPIAIRDW